MTLIRRRLSLAPKREHAFRYPSRPLIPGSGRVRLLQIGRLV